jgi:hypothetical protein
MTLLVLPERFAVVQRSLGVERPLSSTLLVQVVRVVWGECDNYARLDIVRLSTEVHTTHC